MCTSVDEGACMANSKSAGFQAVLQRSAGVGKRLFYNRQVLSKNSSSAVSSLSSSLVPLFPFTGGGGFLAQSSLGPGPGSGLVSCFLLIYLTMAASRLFFALALVVTLRDTA